MTCICYILYLYASAEVDDGYIFDQLYWFNGLPIKFIIIQLKNTKLLIIFPAMYEGVKVLRKSLIRNPWIMSTTFEFIGI